MKVKRSTWLHRPDLYVFDKHIVARRNVLTFVKPVVFRLRTSKAKEVWLVGNFARDRFQHRRMKKTVDGYWECVVELKRGHYEYHFLVDGVPLADPHAIARVANEQGGFNSVVEVG